MSFVYKFRCECQSDLWQVMLLGEIEDTKLVVENCVELTTNQTIDEIRTIMGKVVDTHVMRETLNYADKYDGSRWYNDPQNDVSEIVEEEFNEKDIKVGDIVVAETAKKVNNYFTGSYYAIVLKEYKNNMFLIERISFCKEFPKNSACKIIDLEKNEIVDYNKSGNTVKKSLNKLRKWDGVTLDERVNQCYSL